MKLIIITGMSGSGKTQAIRFFEDAGYFCIDNLPPVLIPKLMDLFKSMSGGKANVVLVIDMRVGDMIEELINQIKILKSDGFVCDLLFLDANNATLVKRYKETRRTHPLNHPNGLLEGIKSEREILKNLYNSADAVIDTSMLRLKDLHQRLKEMYVDDSLSTNIFVHVLAFGFKYGAPLDADLVFDVRCFPNPFYVEELKYKTGNDIEVQEYVMKHKESVDFMRKLNSMIEFLLPLYVREGKNTLTIAIGCTGGKHRSVTMTNKLCDHIKKLGYNANCVYRDIGKE